jgi:hypothetical protein
MNVVDLQHRRSGKQKAFFSRHSPRRFGPAIVVLLFGSILITIVFLLLSFRSALINRYVKARLEAAFSQSHPGYQLRLGRLDYSIGSKRLSSRTAELTGATVRVTCGEVSVTGIPWLSLLWRKASTANMLGHANLVLTNFEAQFSSAGYRMRCARVEASAQDSALIVLNAELAPLVGDESFFAAHDFRTTRFRGVVPEFKVLGLNYQEILQGKAYRAHSVLVSRPSFDILVNRDKPPQVLQKSPLTPNDALATIRLPVHLDHLIITNGNLTYAERVIAGGEPGVLTFNAANLDIEGIANRAESSSAMVVRATSRFMNAGALTLLLTMPVASTNFSLYYSGSLRVMDLIHLDTFLEPAEQLRIKSGSAQEVNFNIDVSSGLARGNVRASYADLKIAFLDKQTGSEKGIENRLSSLLANALKIRNSSHSDASGLLKEGQVDYARGSQDGFVQYLWFALRTGVLDVISH